MRKWSSAGLSLMRAGRTPGASRTVGAMDKDQILERVVRFYLESSDFNGIPAWQLMQEYQQTNDVLKGILRELIESGSVAANFGDRHPNPHIRALPDEPIERQSEKISETEAPGYCVYPTKRALERFVDQSTYTGRPFTLELALGEPQLAFRTFDLSVLEVYRNDPRYTYTTDDISGSISVHDRHYESEEMRSSDKVLLQSFGFAYDAELNRAVAVFLRYLADLSAEHQGIWQARLISNGYRLHPDYYRSSILGEWYERRSLFQAFIEELKLINEMSAAMGRSSLFRNAFEDRPREFAFLIRPTLKEFNSFVHLLDKMMSENINLAFFRGDVPLEEEEIRSDGKVVVKTKGSIAVLDEWLRKMYRTPEPEPLEETLQTFRKVRKLRQKPAHSVNDDAFGQQFAQRQRMLMVEAYNAVRTLRMIFEKHPLATGVKVDEDLRKGLIWSY